MAYTYIEDIGSGGFAKVAKVLDSKDGNEYAQKTYSPLRSLIDAVGDENLKKRFKKEVRYQSALSHPNIVPVIDSFLENDPPCFIMPLADCTLKDELHVDPTMGGDPRKALFDILAGLEELHSNGYVHRDLKPANVLKFSRQEGYEYALSDFGLISGVGSESTALTGSNDGGGTAIYAAPELTNGLKKATSYADIYSFGAILHDIFAPGVNRVPYTELTVAGAMGDVISKCTKTLPRRRYASVDQLRSDLYDVLNAGPVQFHSSSEQAVVGLLDSGNVLTEEQWDSVFIQLEDNLDKNLSCSSIFSSLSSAHIQHLHSDSPELFSALGEYYSDYVQEGGFDFDYCDVLASKSSQFFELGDIQLRSKVAISLLVMGVKHNRWYVERKFVTMAGSDASEAFINRLVVELEVQEINASWYLKHLLSSIGVDRSVLHEALGRFLDD